MRKRSMRSGAILVALGLLWSPLVAAERPADGAPPPGVNAQVSGPIRTLDDFFQRLALDYDFRGEPDPAWVAEPGAPPLSPVALRLALGDSLRDSQSLIEIARGLEALLASQEGTLSPAGHARVRAQVAKIKWHAQQLSKDPYLGFLDMGRSGSRSAGSPVRSPLAAATAIRKDAEEVGLGLELFLQGESHRVVDWRQFSSPSPRALSREIFELARLVESGLRDAGVRADSFVSGK